MSELTIVIVDDEKVDRYVARRVVNAALPNSRVIEFDAGDRFVEAISTAEARRAAFGDAPAPFLVFLDINMPRMSGFEVLDALQKLGPIASDLLVVTMYSSSDYGADRADAVKYDFVKGYTVKPLTQESFLQIVDEYVR